VTAHGEYLAILAGAWLSLLWVDGRYGTGVRRRWRRLLVVEVVTIALFLAWDSLGVHRHYWRSEPGRVVGIWPLPGVPLEELILLTMITYGAVVLWRLIDVVQRRSAGEATP